MPERRRLKRRRAHTPASHYLALPPSQKNQGYVGSGAALLDCALGGGWARDRMINIVGDSSTGKTLLAIEACANFARHFPKAFVQYAEAESAFDETYAQAVGFPSDHVEFKVPASESGVTLVEDVYTWLEELADVCRKEKQAGMFIVDSLDAVSSRKEMARDINDDSYGTERARKLSEAVRKVNANISSAGITLIIISQTRKKIGVTFGNPNTRSGGAALDFYASQIVWLSERGKIKKTIRGVERSIGKNIVVRVTKNKAGLAHRDCDLTLLFGYGIDDLTSNAEFLKKTVGLDYEPIASLELGATTYKNKILKLRNEGGHELRAARALLAETVEDVWLNLERDFLPKRGKYE